MRVCKTFVRTLALAGLCCVAVGTVRGQAPTVTVSPSDLSFGVPGTMLNVASSSQPISVTVAGSGTAMVSITKSGSGDFTETDNCSGAISAPGCVINVTFKPSATGLESASWTITPTPGTAKIVTLTGALGAVPLFTNSVNVATSNGGASVSSPVTFGSQSYNLVCPAGAPAKISSSPDGSGKVVLDNYLILASGPTPTSQVPFGNGAPAGNVCTGGVTDMNGNITQNDCFTDTYRAIASSNNATGANGLDPDNFTSTWGVAPIDVSGAFSGNVTATFNQLDEGVVLTSSRLFLVSQCTVAGVVPGGSITGNPVDPAKPETQTQTSTFDNVGGQTGALTTDTSNSPNSVAKGTTQVTTDFAVPQQLFSQLVQGTSAAPAVCLRLNMEQDSANKGLDGKIPTMCKAFLIQCWDPTHTTLTGDNCITTPSAARNLFDATKYDSDDAPAGQNYLLSACSGVASTCAQPVIGDASHTMLVGPGMLLGGDQWLCPFGSGGTSCSNQTDLNTATHMAPPSYDPLNCVLTGSLDGDLCPLDTLTQFKGAADPVHGSTTSGKNSIFIPVTNVPLPFTQATVTGRNTNGWVTDTSVSATFISNQANYIPATGNPGANGFTPAPPYSLTYGFAVATATAPDTTFPVTNDVSNFNTGTTPNFGKPLCNKTGVPNPFNSSTQAPYMAQGEGFYNMHYFTTDCALTEELLFQPTSDQLTDANANWASFRTIAFGIDNAAPSLTCQGPAGPDGSNKWYKTLPTESCQASDDFSGFDQSTDPYQPTAPTAAPNTGCDPNVYPDCVVKQGVTSFNYSVIATGTGGLTQIPQQIVYDLAGHASPTQSAIQTPLDGMAPSFSVQFSAAGTNFTVGQHVTAKFNCADTISGLGTCGNQVFACSNAPTVDTPMTFANTTGIPIDTNTVGPHTFNAVDCAGNPSTTSVTYNVAPGSAELLIANVPNPLSSVKNGNNLTYNIFVLNLGPNTASNIVVTDAIPANATYVSAVSNTVACSLAGCNTISSGVPCTLNGDVLTCTTPTVKPVLTSGTGFVIKLVVKVSAPAGVKSVSDTATVSSDNPDPIKGDNHVTVTTKVTQ